MYDFMNLCFNFHFSYVNQLMLNMLILSIFMILCLIINFNIFILSIFMILCLVFKF